MQHQKGILLKNNNNLESKLEIDNEWYNTLQGKIWIAKTIQKSNNIQDSDILLKFIDYL